MKTLNLSIFLNLVHLYSLTTCAFVAQRVGRTPFVPEDSVLLPGDPRGVDFEEVEVGEDLGSINTGITRLYPNEKSNVDFTSSSLNIDELLLREEITRENSLLPCAKVARIEVDYVAGTFLLDLSIRTGGIFKEGCHGVAHVSYLPGLDAPQQQRSQKTQQIATESRHGVGERCVSKMGIRIDITEDFAYETSFHCLELIGMVGSMVVPKPLDLHYSFEVPVLENVLERVFVQHRGDPHSDTVPFTGISFQAQSTRTSPLPERFVGRSGNPNILEEDYENPDCFEFGTEGRFAYDPPRFETLDIRKLRSRLFASGGQRLTPMAAYSHSFEVEEDVFSVGIDDLVDPEQEFDMEWKRDPPLSPFLYAAAQEFFSILTKIQIEAQLSVNQYFYPDAWNTEIYWTDQGIFQRPTRAKTVLNRGDGGDCVMSTLDMLETIMELEGVRNFLNIQNLSTIARIPTSLSISHQATVNLEKQVLALVTKFLRFVESTGASFPALISTLTRTRGSPAELLTARSSVDFDYSCGSTDSSASPSHGISPSAWRKLFAPNPDLALHPSLFDIIRDLSSTWEPVFCAPAGTVEESTEGSFGNEGRYGCLGVQQVGCRSRDRSVQRKVVMNMQSQDPTCKIWKPKLRRSDAAFINGQIYSSTGSFTISYENVLVKNRKGETEIEGIQKDSTSIFNRYFLEKSNLPKVTLITDRESLSQSSPTKDLGDEIHFLQCGQVHEDLNRRGENPTSNPYKTRCSPDDYFPHTPEYRGCSPLNLESQRNFVPIPNALLRDNVLGSDCGEMNFNSGEASGSHLREVMERAGPSGNILSYANRVDSTLNAGRLAAFINSPELCNSGQTCRHPSPNSLIKEWETWEGLIEGEIISAKKKAEEDLAIVTAYNFTRPCFFGEHGGRSNSLFDPETDEIGTFARLTRSNYEPYEFINSGEINNGREALFASKYYDPFGDITDVDSVSSNLQALTRNKGFCGSQGALGVPQSLAPLMSPDLSNIYHPVGWVDIPKFMSVNDIVVDSGEVDTSATPNTFLRHHLHGIPLPSTPAEDVVSSPIFLPSPSPTSTLPSPTPTPTPLQAPPIPSPTPTSTQLPFDRRSQPRFLYEDRKNQNSIFLRTSASFTTRLTLPLPKQVRELKLPQTNSCVTSYPTSLALSLYPTPEDPSLTPLLGRLRVDLATFSSLRSLSPSQTIPIYLTLVCIPITTSGVCWNPHATNTYVTNTCSNLDFEAITVSSSKLKKELLQDLLSLESAADDTRDTFQSAFVETALSHGRVTTISWNSTTRSLVDYDWGVFWKPNNCDSPPCTGRPKPVRDKYGSAMYSSFLSVHRPDVYVAKDVPVQYLEESRIVRFLDRTERVPLTTDLCKPDYGSICNGFGIETRTTAFALQYPRSIEDIEMEDDTILTPSPNPIPTPTTFIPPQFTVNPSPIPSPSPFRRIVDGSSSGDDDDDCSFFDLSCCGKEGNLFDCPFFITLVAVGGAIVLGMVGLVIWECVGSHRKHPGAKELAEVSKKNK